MALTTPPIEYSSGPKRDNSGKFAAGKEPDLINIRVTNPLTYFKLWLQKVLNNEGMDVRLRIHPLTMIIIAAAFAIGGFSIGRVTLLSQLSKTPLAKYLSLPTDSQVLIKDVVYTGHIRYLPANNKYYLETASGDVVALSIPSALDISNSIGQKVLITGKLNTQTGIIIVEDISTISQ